MSTTSTALPGEQWEPSNGTDGWAFIEQWCTRCARDKSMREGEPIEECDDNECCEILGASFRGEAVEWREMPDGEVKCIGYVPAGGDIPDPRCEHTLELFGGAE